MKFGIKITKYCFPLFVKTVNSGVNITKYQQIFRNVNFFENNILGVISVIFLENIIFGVRSVSFFEKIILGSEVYFSKISFWESEV